MQDEEEECDYVPPEESVILACARAINERLRRDNRVLAPLVPIRTIIQSISPSRNIQQIPREWENQGDKSAGNEHTS